MDIEKTKKEYLDDVYQEMKHRGFISEEIPRVIAKTGFMEALNEYTEEQLLYSIEDAVDEIMLVAARSQTGREVKPLVKETLDLLEMLPDEYVAEVNEYTKTIIKKWDPDYTKLTSSEKASLEAAEEEIKNGEVFSEDEVWT